MSVLTGKATIDEVKEWEGKRVLCRVDYNVKVKKGQVTDRKRIDATLETLREILAKRGPNGRGVRCIVLITHLGRPGAKYNRADFSLEPVAAELQKVCIVHPLIISHSYSLLLQDFPQNEVRFLPECVGDAVEAAINSSNYPDGTIFVTENLRFHPEETGIALEEGPSGQVTKVRVPFEDRVEFGKKLSELFT